MDACKDAGRNFAVVASEVRSLAGRSADAAKEIKSLINASVERVEQGTALVEEMATAASSLKSQELVQTVAGFKLEQGGGAHVMPRVVATTYTPSRAPIQTRLPPNWPAEPYQKWAMHVNVLGNASAKQGDEAWETF